MSDYALRYPAGEIDLAVHPATVGSSGLNICSVLTKSGNVTLDTGFMNTASCESAITYIDGDAGILRYRGYPIEPLAEQSSFYEVVYLLIYGNLPTAAEYATFDDLRKITTTGEKRLKALTAR